MERRVLDGEVTLQDRELWRLKCKDLFFQVCGRSRTFYLSSKHQQMPPGCRVFSTVYSRGVFARHIDIDMFERFACLSKKYEDWESLLHKLKAGALYLFLIGSQAFRLKPYALFRPIPFLYGMIAIMYQNQTWKITTVNHANGR